MPLLDTGTAARPANVWREDRVDDEVGALKDALRVARSNPWLAEDVIDPELESFMEAIELSGAASAVPAIERDRPNPWQEFIDAAS